MQTTPLSDSRNLWPVFGHDWAVRLLSQTVLPVQQGSPESSRLGPRHAYLFVGPGQVGKTTLVRAFATALFCTGGSSPCGVCRSCRLMAHGNHPDFHLLQPLDKDGVVDRANGELRVDQAAAIIHAAALRPVEGRFRFFLLQDAHLANASFANKLLKTLEEPPEQVILCLTALDRASLLPTIVSRCQVLELRPLDTLAVETALQIGWHVEAVQARLLARLSRGRLGWAVRQLERKDEWQQRRDQLRTLWKLMAGDRIERLAFAEQVAAGRENAQLFGMLALWAVWWRDIMLAQSGCLDACSNVDLYDEIARQAAAIPPASTLQFLQTLGRIEGYLHHTVNTRLALDTLVLNLPLLDRLPAG